MPERVSRKQNSSRASQQQKQRKEPCSANMEEGEGHSKALDIASSPFNFSQPILTRLINLSLTKYN